MRNNETKRKERRHKKAAGNFFIMQKRVHKKCQKCQREQPKYKIYNIFKCNKAAKAADMRMYIPLHTYMYAYTYIHLSLAGIRLINVYRIATLCVFMRTCVRIYKSRNSCPNIVNTLQTPAHPQPQPCRAFILFQYFVAQCVIRECTQNAISLAISC